MGKFFFGMMIYLLVAQVSQIALIALDTHFKWGLQTRTLATLPLIGKITPLAVIFIVILVGLRWALYRLNI